jgi:hypothetical protein
VKGLIEMLKSNWQAVVLVLALAVVAGMGFKGCNEKQRQDFRTGVKIGTAAAIEVRESVDDYCRAELLTPESCEKAIPHTEKLADVAQRLNNFVERTPKLTVENKAEALALADELISEVDALEADGVVEFKDPEHRRNFLLAIAIGKSAIRVTRAAIDAAPVEPAATPSPAL